LAIKLDENNISLWMFSDIFEEFAKTMLFFKKKKNAFFCIICGCILIFPGMTNFHDMCRFPPVRRYFVRKEVITNSKLFGTVGKYHSISSGEAEKFLPLEMTL